MRLYHTMLKKVLEHKDKLVAFVECGGDKRKGRIIAYNLTRYWDEPRHINNDVAAILWGKLSAKEKETFAVEYVFDNPETMYDWLVAEEYVEDEDL